MLNLFQHPWHKDADRAMDPRIKSGTGTETRLQVTAIKNIIAVPYGSSKLESP
jgi:hypothetical protein